MRRRREQAVDHFKMSKRLLSVRLGLVCCAAGAVVFVGLGGGCQANPQAVGMTGVEASFVLGTLRAQLSPRVTVMTALAAAEIALRDQGFVISDRTASEGRGRLRAKRGNAGLFAGVVVSVSPAAQGTGISVFVEPMGDEVASRVLMEAIVLRVGGVAARGIWQPVGEGVPVSDVRD